MLFENLWRTLMIIFLHYNIKINKTNKKQRIKNVKRITVGFKELSNDNQPL